MSRLRLPRFSSLPHALLQTVISIRDILNGRLWPGDNFLQHRESGTTPGTADTEFTITHNLDRDPNVVEFVYWLQGAGTVYQSTTAWTRNAIYLKCTVISADYTIIVR